MKYAQDAAGWTTVPVAANAQFIHVDAMSGSDSATGSVSTPLKTLAGVKKMMTGSVQYVVKLRAGQTFTGPLDLTDGGSSQAPDVWMTWGEGPRATVTIPLSQQVCINAWQAKNVVIQGLRMTVNRRPGDPGWSKGNPKQPLYGIRYWNCHNILVEDCIFELFAYNVSIERDDGKTSTEICIRRSSICDAYAPTEESHSQGLYSHGIAGLELEDVWFIDNGQMDGVSRGTVFNHNAYIDGTNSDVWTNGIISVGAASHGIQQRSGGVMEDYFAIDCPIPASYGYVGGGGSRVKGGVVGHIKGFVAFGNAAIDSGGPRSTGLQVGNIKSAIAENLLFCNDKCKQVGQSALSFNFDEKAATAADDVGIIDFKVVNFGLVDWKGRTTVEESVSMGTGPGKIQKKIPVQFPAAGTDTNAEKFMTYSPTVHVNPVTLNQVLATVGHNEVTIRQHIRTRPRRQWNPKLTAQAFVEVALQLSGLVAVPTPPASASLELSIHTADGTPVSFPNPLGVKEPPKLAIIANVDPQPAKVQFFLNGAAYKEESGKPYSMAGDSSGVYGLVTFPEGKNTVLGIALDASGRELARDTLEIEVKLVSTELAKSSLNASKGGLAQAMNDLNKAAVLAVQGNAGSQALTVEISTAKANITDATAAIDRALLLL